MTTEFEMSDRSGAVHVLLDPAGDHIVTKLMDDPKRGQFALMLPAESFAFEGWVKRAERARAFL